MDSVGFEPGLVKRREILVFPRTTGNTGISWKLLVFPWKYWEITGNSSYRVHASAITSKILTHSQEQQTTVDKNILFIIIKPIKQYCTII